VSASRLSAEQWDTAAESALAAWIATYLADSPPPGGSEIARNLATWSLNLEDHARAASSSPLTDEAAMREVVAVMARIVDRLPPTSDVRVQLVVLSARIEQELARGRFAEGEE
jgi:hypothetical protein